MNEMLPGITTQRQLILFGIVLFVFIVGVAMFAGRIIEHNRKRSGDTDGIERLPAAVVTDGGMHDHPSG
jgi:hypothetical protein